MMDIIYVSINKKIRRQNFMKYDYVEYVQMFKALADETRLKIINMLT